MCPARFFEAKSCVSSQKTQNTVTHRHTVTDTAVTAALRTQNQLVQPHKVKETPLFVGKSQPLNPPKCEQTPSERWLTASQPSLAVTAHTTLINSSFIVTYIISRFKFCWKELRCDST